MKLLNTTLILFSLFILFPSCEQGEKFTIEGKYCYEEDSETIDSEYYACDENGERIELEVGLYKMTKLNPTQLDLQTKRAFKLVDSQKLSNKGKFSFSGKVDLNEPQIYFVGIGRPEALFDMGSYSNEVQMFVAEPGEIAMKLYYDRAEVTGTPINEELSKIYYKDIGTPLRAFEDSIRTIETPRIDYENPKEYQAYRDTQLERDSVRTAIKEKIEKDYADGLYSFLKEHADKQFSNFFVSSAKAYLTEEQLEEVKQIGGGVFNTDVEEEEWY